MRLALIVALSAVLSAGARADSFEDQLNGIGESISAQARGLRQTMAASRLAAAAQPQGPIVPKGTPKRYVDLFKDGWRNMMSHLKDKDCQKLFLSHGFGPDQVIQTLRKTTYYFDPLQQGPGVGAQTSGADTVFINTEGIFVTARDGHITLNRVAYALSNDSDVRAMVLFHELGHQLGFFGTDYGTPELDEQNAQHSLAVIDACFPGHGIPLQR